MASVSAHQRRSKTLEAGEEDRPAMPLALLSLPILIIGLHALRANRRTVRARPAAEHVPAAFE
jgi:hypothetical protein